MPTSPEPHAVRVQIESMPASAASGTRRDWIALSIASLPGLAAIIALIFTAQSLQTTDKELAENGQQVNINSQVEITDRFNAAVTNLSSSNTVIQLGGIYGLQGIMTDSPQDQPTALNVLCAYVRYHDPLASAVTASPKDVVAPPVSSDVQAALTVIGGRNPSYDGSAIINLERTNLISADLTRAHLARADFEGSDLASANLDGSNLSQAHLEDANFEGAQFTGTNLQGSDLSNSSMQGVQFQDSQLYKAVFAGANLTGVYIFDSDLRFANFSRAQMSSASIYGSSLNNAYFVSTNLQGASMVDEEMTYVSLAYAHLQGADLEEANLTGATLSDGVLKGADIHGAILANTRITTVPAPCIEPPTTPTASPMIQGYSALPSNGEQIAVPC
jgi:uncharacterized protein YjbI with pentapeptide repeats